MSKELPPKYDPHGLENKWYKVWEKKSLFSYDLYQNYLSKEKFCMVIPPPNITGSLHLGHALNHTIQDIFARYHRMKGFSVLWIPGTDHAGIATQNVVERLLAQENISRYDLGRKEFEARVWIWKEKSSNMISHQQRQLGESVDWSKERFTFDHGLNKIVKLVFIKLYEEGLIYRAKKMINWCPVNQTALSNIEVEYKTIQGSLYYIRYPIAGENDSMLVATTRPETMLGDEALAVNPEDARYKKYIGKKAILPLMSKEIPVIADKYVEQSFGTGVVKITPGHDPNDFEVGQKHSLPVTIVMNKQAQINERGGRYQGLSRDKAREKIIADLEKEGLLERAEKYEHQVGHSYRSGAVIEPVPSIQWFVSTKPLAEKAIKAVKEDQIKFIPQRWENIYFDWMHNIQDWCISRQLWWGHRIPAWYDEENNVYVGLEVEEIRKKYKLSKDISLRQEEDVLDTWFSSALWSFATLWSEEEILSSEGWPPPSQLHENFYPNNVLVTSFDIIFFWVARMVMFGLHFMKDVPFRRVYIHGLVRDANRQKMSKSKGNVVNPLEKMEEYGTDAFRFFLISILPEGKDIIYDESRIKGYQAFCNKIWNTARFIWMNQSPDYDPKNMNADQLDPTESDSWIIHHFNHTLEKIEHSLKNYKLSEYAQTIYDFTWKSYCDHYIELAKISLKDKSQRGSTLYFLNLIFQNILKLLHPIMPFITEELYSYWGDRNTENNDLIIVSKWPQKIELKNKKAFIQIEEIIHLLYVIRNIRGELSIPPSNKIDAMVFLENRKKKEIFVKYREHIISLARLGRLEFIEDKAKMHGLKAMLDFGTLFLDIKDKVDITKEKQRITKDIEKIEQKLSLLSKRLNNKKFIENAPEDIVLTEKKRLIFLEKKKKDLDNLLERLILS